MGEHQEGDYVILSAAEQDRALAGVILAAKLDLLARQPWRKKAACRWANPDDFILASGANSTEGKKFCAKCPVRDECFAFAHKHKCMGLWGGVMFTVNSTPQAPAAAPVEIKPLTIIQDGRAVSVVDESVLDIFG